MADPLPNELPAGVSCRKLAVFKDGRGTLATITEKGRETVDAATRDLMAMDFGLGAYDAEECAEIFAMLRPLRVAARDFDEE